MQFSRKRRKEAEAPRLHRLFLAAPTLSLFNPTSNDITSFHVILHTHVFHLLLLGIIPAFTLFTSTDFEQPLLASSIFFFFFFFSPPQSNDDAQCLSTKLVKTPLAFTARINGSVFFFFFFFLTSSPDGGEESQD